MNGPTIHFRDTASRKLWRLYGHAFYRPLRRFFFRMIAASHHRPTIEKTPEWMRDRKTIFNKYRLPNTFWHLLYLSVFRFFRWLNYDAWRHFCKWDRVLIHKPWLAKVIHWIGSYTAGSVISGGHCPHCGRGMDECELVETQYFELTRSGVSSTMDGSDYWFEGWITCPNCNTKIEFSDSSL